MYVNFGQGGCRTTLLMQDILRKFMWPKSPLTSLQQQNPSSYAGSSKGQVRECAVIPVNGAVRVEARRPYPCITLRMRMHVQAEAYQELPAPAVEQRKQRLRSTQSPNEELKMRKSTWPKKSWWQNLLCNQCSRIFRQVAHVSRDSALQPSPKSTVVELVESVESLSQQVLMCPRALAVADPAGCAPAEEGAPRGLSDVKLFACRRAFGSWVLSTIFNTSAYEITKRLHTGGYLY